MSSVRNFSNWYLHFSCLYLFLGLNQNFLLAKSRCMKVNLLLQNTTSKAEMPPLAGNKHFPSVFSLIGRVFLIFRRKMDGLHPSEMNIKMVILAPTSRLSNTASFLNRKTGKLINSKSSRDISECHGKRKKMTKLKKSSQIMHFSSYTGSLVFQL